MSGTVYTCSKLKAGVTLLSKRGLSRILRVLYMHRSEKGGLMENMARVYLVYSRWCTKNIQELSLSVVLLGREEECGVAGVSGEM